MQWSDLVSTIWNYRHSPDPNAVPHIFEYISKEKLLYRKETAIVFAGVVTALCDRHPGFHVTWKQDRFRELITEAYKISRYWKAQASPMWAEYLMNRWLILATDEAAWALLVMCHRAPKKEQVVAAQVCCDKICRTLENGRAIEDRYGNLVGKAQFEDLRIQMLRLANEWRSMTIDDQKLPFAKLPFGEESREIQRAQQAQQTTQISPSLVC